MSKKTGRLLNPGLGLYIGVMLGFCLATALLGQFLLAAVEAAVILLLFASYLLFRKVRRRQLLRFIQDSPNTLESGSRSESPFPTVIIRLGDSGIVWVNDQFVNITGFSDLMSEQYLYVVLPGFKTDWLLDQKTEAPYDITIGSGRYRVYGTIDSRDDNDGGMLGGLYFSDLTNL